MTRLPFDRYAAPRHGAAVLAVAIALAVGVVLVLTSGGGAPRVKAPRAAATPATSAQYPDTPAGAIAAATAWGQTATQAGFNGTWATALRPLTTAAFWMRLKSGQRASALIHARITSLHTPFAIRRWPLGYAVESYSPTTAQVRVWELGVIGISGPFDVTAFDTRTVSLQWVDGDWKIADVSHGPDLTPPGRNASASLVASWVTAVDQLRSYSYAP
ncbi:MAG: hypothetical protein M3065_06460 [Actinomycetota bacterium]|nr:hypothetical protein [Actinomycetota bacterium]